MSDSEYFEHESENSFDDNEDNEIDNLGERFKGCEQNPTNSSLLKNMKNHRKRAVRLRRKTSFRLIIGKTFELERENGARARIVELSLKRLTVFVPGKSSNIR